MPRYAYDRLTALDNSFLLLERGNANMHVASTAIHALGPLRGPDGGVDIERVRRAIGAALHRIPRYRQKLAWVPLEGRPVWVDDPSFQLQFHVRHTSLPRPGDREQLDKLTARLMAQRLDRHRPLWELWVVEGLEGDRFALVNKVHHCMIDGVSGVDLLNVLLQTDPDAHPDEDEAPPFLPRPMPSGAELLADAFWRTLRLPFEAIRDVRRALGEAEDAGRELRVRLRAAAETLGATLKPAAPSPFNQPIGPHRRFRGVRMDLAELRRVRRELGGSLNDLVLAITAGAVRRFYEHRRIPTAGAEFRVMAPVSVRHPEEHGRLGNRVSAWIVPLPIDEPDPLARLRRITARTDELKASRAAVGAELMTRAAEWTPATLLTLGARNMTRLLPFSLVVTNIPGPQTRLYLAGAPLEEIYPLVPLPDGLALGIALFSYDGSLFWGLNADEEQLPDLDVFAAALGESAQELAKRADAGLRRTRRRQARATSAATAKT